MKFRVFGGPPEEVELYVSDGGILRIRRSEEKRRSGAAWTDPDILHCAPCDEEAREAVANYRTIERLAETK